MIFSAASAQQNDQLVFQFAFADAETIFIWNILCHAKSTTAWNDRYLVDDMCTIEVPRGQRMPRLMVRSFSFSLSCSTSSRLAPIRILSRA